MSEEGVEGGLVELLDRFVVVGLPAYAPLFGDGGFYLLPVDGAVGGQHRDVGETLLHHHCPYVGAFHGVAGFADEVLGYAVPAFFFLEGEVAVQFQVEGVELAYFGVLCFLGNAAGYVQLGGLGVEV